MGALGGRWARTVVITTEKEDADQTPCSMQDNKLLHIAFHS